MSTKKDNKLAIQQLKAFVEYRKKHEAPVDTMGCHMLGEREDPKVYRFQTLISLMLSSQTKDIETHKAMERLKGIDGGLIPSVLMKQDVKYIDSLIKNVGFHNKKAENIILAAKKCEEEYDGDIPKNLEELITFKGVGMKMGTLAMNHCWNKLDGIGVDVHVHRIANMLKWCKTNKPDDTEKALQELFPKELWFEINSALVGIGQTICGSKKKLCDECPIKATCPYNSSKRIDDE